MFSVRPSNGSFLFLWLTEVFIGIKLELSSLKFGDYLMKIAWVKKLFRILYLAPIVLVVSLLVTTLFIYFVVVVDIYANTEKLSDVNPSINAYCEKIALNPKFTKGPVVFRVDNGTLFSRLDLFISGKSLSGYSPFFIFPHHRTIILSKELLKMDKTILTYMIAHELGHIQGGLKHFGSSRKMENYANDFATEIVKTKP